MTPFTRFALLFAFVFAAFTAGKFIPAVAAFEPFFFAVGTFFATFGVVMFLSRFFDFGRPGSHRPRPGSAFDQAVFGGLFAVAVFASLQVLGKKPGFEEFRDEVRFAFTAVAASVAAGVVFARVSGFGAGFFGRRFRSNGGDDRTTKVSPAETTAA